MLFFYNGILLLKNFKVLLLSALGWPWSSISLSDHLPNEPISFRKA